MNEAILQTNLDLSIVTPTYRRPFEVKGLLENIARQSVLPTKVILVDGAPENENATELVVAEIEPELPFAVKYLRRRGGTAVQRNAGIDVAAGKFIALIDDDVRLEPRFLENVLEIFDNDCEISIGGVVGFRTNQHFTADQSSRWRWYKRLRLLSVFEPGRYDFKCGYPINSFLQEPFSGVRSVDFMTTACAVWRREVFDSGLRFDSFFLDYGVLEDAHFSLRAGRQWRLLQAGDAHCEELHSPNGRVDRRKLGYKCVVNYYYVFRDIAGPLTMSQKFRFWRFQTFEFFRIGTSALRRRNWHDVLDLQGRLEGMLSTLFSKPENVTQSKVL